MNAIRALAGALAALAVVTGLAAGFAWAAATIRQRDRQERSGGYAQAGKWYAAKEFADYWDPEQPAHLSQWERRP